MRFGLCAMVAVLWGGSLLVGSASAIATSDNRPEYRVQSWNQCDREIAAFETEQFYINICQQTNGDLIGSVRSKEGDDEIHFSDVRPINGNSYCLEGNDATTYLVTPYEIEVWQHNRLVGVDRVLEQY
ncbi:hypothetical protein [Baaleninema simplex]|uniref:hypothetical protein n=1 Tax=Baaleninema simplex TaxID=2862350 RepID=UPI000369DCF1|nr:hypothetical protein [Baaleninema simplex]